MLCAGNTAVTRHRHVIGPQDNMMSCAQQPCSATYHNIQVFVSPHDHEGARLSWPKHRKVRQGTGGGYVPTVPREWRAQRLCQRSDPTSPPSPLTPGFCPAAAPSSWAWALVCSLQRSPTVGSLSLLQSQPVQERWQQSHPWPCCRITWRVSTLVSPAEIRIELVQVGVPASVLFNKLYRRF